MNDLCRKGLHEFTPENTAIQSNGNRRCRACTRAQANAWAARNREKMRALQRTYYAAYSKAYKDERKARNRAAYRIAQEQAEAFRHISDPAKFIVIPREEFEHYAAGA